MKRKSKSRDRFLEVRKALGFTQEQMAALLGVTIMSIRNYEQKEPVLGEEKRHILQKIGVNAAYILIGEPEDYYLEHFSAKQVHDNALKAIGAEAAA